MYSSYLETLMSRYFAASERRTLCQTLLEKYASPAHEKSVAKGIPMEYVEDIQILFPGKFRYRYRGPSTAGYWRPQSYCHKLVATNFALYERC